MNAEIVSMNEEKSSPDKIELAERERLRLENVNLKMKLLDIEKQALINELDGYVQRIIERTGVNIRNYSIDLKNGLCTKLED